MRIAHVVPFRVHPYSGVLSAVAHLSAALAQRGHRVELWQPGAWPDAARALADLVAGAGVEIVALPDLDGPWRLSAATRAVVAARPVDIVQLHNVFSPMNNLIARRLRAPYALYPHGGYAPAVLEHHRIRKAGFKWLFELPMMRRAALVVALSEAEAEDVRRYGYRGPVQVVPPGIDPPEPGLDRAAVRRLLGVDASGRRLAVFVGRLDLRHKRLDMLVESMAEASAWQLALVGPDWQGGAARLARLVERLGLGDRVHLVAPRRGRALQEVLAAADLFVLASRWEGLSLSLLEALVQGVPALVSPEVERTLGVAAAGAGWLAQPRELGACLRKIASFDAPEWERRRAAAARLGAGFRWEETAARYEAAIAPIVARPAG